METSRLFGMLFYAPLPFHFNTLLTPLHCGPSPGGGHLTGCYCMKAISVATIHCDFDPADDWSDSEGSQQIYLMAAALVAVGLSILFVAMATLWATIWKMYNRIRDTGHAGADEHAGLSAQVAWFAHHREKLRPDVTGAADAPNTELGVQAEMSRLGQERWRELSEEEKGEWEAL